MSPLRDVALRGCLDVDGHGRPRAQLVGVWPRSGTSVADLLLAYQRETAVELGKDPPARPEEVWGPVRHEVINPASAFTTYLIAYDGCHPLGGVGLVAHDAVTVKLTRCYVRPDARRRGVARALVGVAAEQAAQRGVMRLVLDILATRETAITAWRRLGFVECEPRGDTAMRYFEYRSQLPPDPRGSSRWKVIAIERA